ncbi:hypothetical protein, partial [Anaplasma phagocytophilum]|uniref:hypothetical protein n=1 Tax=Anaplasma phagocytophilum TaxID=948 RepID=UPI000A6D9A5B
MTLLLKKNPPRKSTKLLGGMIDFLLCRDQNSSPERRRIVTRLAEGFTLREGCTVSPAHMDRDLTPPDALARAMHDTARDSSAFREVPFQLWHALALVYNSVPGKNQNEDLNNFVLGCLEGLSEEMTIVREDISSTVEVQSYTAPSKMRALLAVASDVPESYKSSGALTIHESCAFSIRDKSNLVVAQLKMWVEYDIAPSKKVDGVYRASLKRVKLVLTERDSRPVRSGAPGSVCNWSDIPKPLSKHYVRVPDEPTHVWYSTCNLQIHNPKYMMRRVFHDVRNVEECVTRAYGVISGMPLPLIKLPFCNALVERQENGDYRVVVRSTVTPAGYGTSNVVQQGAARHGEGDSGLKVGVCMSFVASLAKSTYATI